MRIFNWAFLLVLIYTANGDFTKCGTCEDLVDNVAADVRSFSSYIGNLKDAACGIQGIPKDACQSTWKYIQDSLNNLNNEVFVRPSAARLTLICSHVLPICPDKKRNGAALSLGIWSCSSCSDLLNIIFEYLSDFVNNVNASALDLFCASGTGHCVDVFKTALNVTGALGRVLHEKKSIEGICKRIIKCID